MLRAISPGNDIYSFRNNYPKKNQIIQISSKKTSLPSIKQTKDQTTTTEEIKSSSNIKNKFNINTNNISKDIQLIKNKYIFKGIVNKGNIEYNFKENDIFSFNGKISFLNTNKNNSNNSKLFFNKNFKLKSIDKTMIKSNSSVNLINKQQTLTIINIPNTDLQKKNSNNLIYQNKSLKKSSSLKKINFFNKNESKNEYVENNNCNFINLKYTGSDHSNINNLKKKKVIVINSHKVIESLKSISIPNDNYGEKLIDIIEKRVNSGYYRKIKFNLGKKPKIYSDFENNIWNNHKVHNNEKNEKKEFSSLFLTDIYDEFLLPDKDNKYNYTIHKIFLTNILNNIFKKMIEIRDIKNRLITKQEIKDEYFNQLNYLRDALYKNKNINVINNNIYNISNNTNIINIDFSNNNSIINEISTIEEVRENSFNINTTNEGKDKDKQYITGKLFNLPKDKRISSEEFNSNNYINIVHYSNSNLENMNSRYKNISIENNQKLLKLIKEKIKTNNMTLHDTCSNIYSYKFGKGTNKKIIQIKKMKNKIKKNLYQKNYIYALTDSFYNEEKKLNNVDKFLLNTKKLRYTFNTYIKTPREERNYSYDLEGNIHHSFNVGPKYNIVNFDDIFDDVQAQYNNANNIDNTFAKIQTLKDIMRYFFKDKNCIHKLKFNNKIIQKYLSMIIPYKNIQIRKKFKRKKKKLEKKKLINILEDISKKIHKKIKIKGGKMIDIETKESKLKKHFNTEENVKGRKKYYNLSESNSIKQTINKENLFTDNIYLEIETNSSEYTDVPSDLDSEIEEMIRKKREREKDKEEEERVYSPKKGINRKGGDFIITNPKDKDKEKQKQKELIKNKQSQVNDNKSKEQINNSSQKEEKLSANLPDKDIQNFSNVYLNSNIDKYLQNSENNDIERARSFKGNKTLIRANTLHLTKTSSATNTTSGKSGIVDMKLNIDINNKNPNAQNIFRKNSLIVNNFKDSNNEKTIFDNITKNKNRDIKNLADSHLKKRGSTLENIIEEEIKEIKKPHRPSKDRKGTKKNTRNKGKKKRTSMRKDININTNHSNNKNPSSATSDYEAYSLNNDITQDNKSTNLPISSKYHENNINEKITGFEQNENINTEKKEENPLEEDKKEEKEIQKNNSFWGNRPKLFTKKDDDEESQKEKIEYKTISYFNSIKNKIDKIMCLENKNELKDGYKKDELSEEKENEEEEEEDNEKKRKRIKRKKKNINIKGVKGLFMGDDNNVEIKKLDDLDVSEIGQIVENPKKIGWEEKFELFKEYIQELKGMNEEQFNYDAMKYLKEKDKEDFSGRTKLSQVERINRYKAFLLQTNKKRINYNNYYTSHVIFTPGCIFNTGELYK